MEKTSKWLCMILVIMLPLMYLGGCETPEEPEINDQGNNNNNNNNGGNQNDTSNVNNELNADLSLSTLGFISSEKLTGTFPQTNNIPRLKMQFKDTLYILPGIKMPVRVLHPANSQIKGFYVASVGSSFYYDVPAFETEPGDTVSSLIIEIKPEIIEENDDIELPYDIPIEIVAHDENDEPIGTSVKILTVEKPNELDYDITIPPSGDTTWSWWWWSTDITNHANEYVSYNTPWYPHVTDESYEGCCDPLQPGGKCASASTVLNATVDVYFTYRIASERFTFYSDGTYLRYTHEKKEFFDPVYTDWCIGLASYTREDSKVYYTGTHDFTPGAEEINFGAGTVSCDLCGYGSTGGKLIYADHVMVIIREVPGSTTHRIYINSEALHEIPEPFSQWYE